MLSYSMRLSGSSATAICCGWSRPLWASGAGVLADEYEMVYFAGDTLLDALRPRGLPIGNLTSQFWSNVYMNGFDWFVRRELGCAAYLRYVDDFALFSDSKAETLPMEAGDCDTLGHVCD